MYSDKPNFVDHNNIVMVHADETTSSAYVDITPVAHNLYGNVHGGLFYSMADNVAGMCARGAGFNHVTLQGSMNYVRGASEGRIIANGHVAHRGRTTCVVNVEIKHENGKVLATGVFTMFNVGPSEA